MNEKKRGYLLGFSLFILAMVSSSFAQTESSKGQNPADAPPIYWLTVQAEKGDHEDGDATVPQNVQPCVIILNDNPATLLSAPTGAFQINHWLKNGQNTLRIQGEDAEGFLVTIVAAKQGEEPITILAEKALTEEKPGVYGVEFSVKVPYFLPIYDSQNEVVDKKTGKSEIVILLAELSKAMRIDRNAAIVSRLTEGHGIWMPLAYGAPAEYVANIQKFAKSFWLNPEYTFSEIDTGSVQIIMGKSTALVYQGISDEGPFLVKYENKAEETSYLPPACLAYIEGRWIVWQ